MYKIVSSLFLLTLTGCATYKSEPQPVNSSVHMHPMHTKAPVYHAPEAQAAPIVIAPVLPATTTTTTPLVVKKHWWTRIHERIHNDLQKWHRPKDTNTN